MSLEDPFFVVKDEIVKAIANNKTVFERWNQYQDPSSLPSKEDIDWTTSELRKGLRSIEWDLEDLEETVAIVEKNPKKFKIDEKEIKSRKAFIEQSRNEVKCMKEAILESKAKNKRMRPSSMELFNSSRTAKYTSLRNEVESPVHRLLDHTQQQQQQRTSQRKKSAWRRCERMLAVPVHVRFPRQLVVALWWAERSVSHRRKDEEDGGTRLRSPIPTTTISAPFHRVRAMASFNEKLVQEVKKHTQLWDQQSKLHKEAGYREAAWMEIAAALDVTVEECQTRWRTLRDTYLKRKKRRRAGANGQWNVLERDLGFLDDFLRPRTRRSTLNAAAPADVEVKQEQPGEDAEMREAAVAAAAAPPLAMRPAAVMPHRLAAGGAAAQELSSDPEEIFCLCLAAHLRGLPPRDRSIAMMKMLQTLHDLESGENIGEFALGDP
ncbi:uncharacterized protein LOC144121759 [Amblyomma americanum]